MNTFSEKISIREKICYGLGDSSANIFLGMTMMFLPYFYTDVLGISAAAMGVLFLVMRLFDACYDPIIGNIADNTKSRFGHYRPYLLYLAIPYGLSCFLCFLAPDFSPMGKLVYACVTYFFLILMYGSVVVPYVALLTVLTSNAAERLSINSYRFPLAKMAFLLCSTLIPILVSMYDKTNEAQAYEVAMSIIAVLATVSLLFCFWGTKERNSMENSKDEMKKSSLLKQVKIIFSTRSTTNYYLFHMFGCMAFTFKGTGTIYFVKYYLQQGDAFLSGVLSATSIAGIIAPIFAMYLIKRGFFTKLGMLSLSTFGGAIMALAILVVPQQYWMVSVFFLFASVFFAELGAIISWALPADCADYCEVKYGEKMSGVIGAGALFAMKLGMSIAGALFGFILSIFNYEPNAAPTGSIAICILILISALPAVCHFVSYFFLRRYNLTDDRMSEVQEELKVRREGICSMEI